MLTTFFFLCREEADSGGKRLISHEAHDMALASIYSGYGFTCHVIHCWDARTK